MMWSRDCYHGGEISVCLNDRPLAPFKAKPLGISFAGNSGMLETNEWGLADLGRSASVYVSMGVRIGCQDFCQGVC